MGQMKQQLENFDDREIDRTEAIIRSMTPGSAATPRCSTARGACASRVDPG
jgi:signal recognition particle subunit SRP54